MTTIKRKLYKRGSSFETTIPMPLLFAINKEKKQNVLFTFDQESSRWYIGFEEAGEIRGKKRGKQQ
jgi:hypothetical protein